MMSSNLSSTFYSKCLSKTYSIKQNLTLTLITQATERRCYFFIFNYQSTNEYLLLLENASSNQSMSPAIFFEKKILCLLSIVPPSLCSNNFCPLPDTIKQNYFTRTSCFSRVFWDTNNVSIQACFGFTLLLDFVVGLIPCAVHVVHNVFASDV